MKLDDKAKACINAWLSGAYRFKKDAVKAFYPSVKNTAQKASTLFNSEETQQYIATRRTEEQADMQSVVNGQRFKWRAQSEGIDTILIEAGVCESILVPNRKEVFENRTALIDRMQIPSSAMQYVDRIEVVKDEDGKTRKCIVVKDIAEKDRLKASELLVRSYGGFTDKQEITGMNGGPMVTQSITTEMTAIEAAEIYQRNIKQRG